jgi:hypothetical protein
MLSSGARNTGMSRESKEGHVCYRSASRLLTQSDYSIYERSDLAGCCSKGGVCMCLILVIYVDATS